MTSKTLRKISFLLAAQFATWGIAYGADFWYRGAAPSTNRTHAAYSAATSGTATEFRMISEKVSLERTFATYPVGLAITIR